MSDLKPVQILRGILSRSAASIQCRIETGGILTCAVGKSPVTVPNYDGEYEITPDQSEHVMQTKGRLMHQDMRVHKIPYQEVCNQSGGITVTIGGY